jgi:hypothetical protein
MTNEIGSRGQESALRDGRSHDADREPPAAAGSAWAIGPFVPPKNRY